MKRSPEDWFALFEAQALSGQSIKSWCGSRSICSKHFSRRRKQLGWEVEETVTRRGSGIGCERFVPVEIQPKLEVPKSEKVVVYYSELRLEFPVGVSSSWLVEVLTGLS